MTEEEFNECEQAERKKHDEKVRERINKMDRVILIMAVQGLINDPDIRAEDLSDEELRKLLLSI